MSFLSVLSVISAAVTILFINPLLGIVAIVLCLPLALSPIVSKKRVEYARNQLMHSTNDLNASASDLLHGFTDWKMYAADKFVNIRYHLSNERWIRDANRDAHVQKDIDAINDCLSHILHFGVWIVGGILILNSRMNVAQIVAFSSLAGSISVPLFYASGLYAQYNAGRETLKEVVSSFKSSLTQAIDTSEVHNHIVIDPHKKYLVIGKSGAGKSTLVKNLVHADSRYLENSLMFDSTIDSEDIRVGHVAQSGHIFNASIRDNIALFNPATTDEEILAACEKAQILH
ncbi:ABC transporter transmembrane domain-containing protein [Alloscardovia venturai]|uniref:ABC transporter transmembrane domain-containing protein n=1 Tax=Alloscardovia venturai TaxID=1769421 RepID=A0ABW2Y5W9_9BIFI